MKKYACLLLLLTCLYACDSAEMNNEIIRANEEKQLLLEESAMKDSIIFVIVQSLNDIGDNLEVVKQKQGIVTMYANSDEKNNLNLREKIIEDIQMINKLMEDNKNRLAWMKSKIDHLSKDLKSSVLKIANFEKMIARLTKSLEEKDLEIGELKDKLVNLNISLDSLSVAYDMQEIEMEGQVAVINTAYYCYGTFKELKEKGVITKEGGFIGIGRTEKLTDDFNKSYFTKIDITETTTIDLYSDKARLITNHPSGSYTLEGPEKGQIDKLVIKEPGEFWSTSKYLVIVVD